LNEELLRDFESVGWAYGPFWNPSVLMSDEWESVKWLLSDYLNERLGGFKSFRDAGVQVAEQFQAEGVPVSHPGLPQLFWRRYVQRLEGRAKGVNAKCSPAAPKGTVHQGATVQSRSIIEIAAEVDQPLFTYMRDRLHEGRTVQLYEMLLGINGVAEKIASFTLRDVVLGSGLNVSRNRYLLQPIDVWVGRCAQIALDSGRPPRARKREDIQRAIVEGCQRAGVDPERANVGMWYFGALIAGQESVLQLATENRDLFRSMVEMHYRQSENAALQYDAIGASWKTRCPEIQRSLPRIS